jgi:hypothetical protein
VVHWYAGSDALSFVPCEIIRHQKHQAYDKAPKKVVGVQVPSCLPIMPWPRTQASRRPSPCAMGILIGKILGPV